jgi:hypothetical protein
MNQLNTLYQAGVGTASSTMSSQNQPPTTTAHPTTTSSSSSRSSTSASSTTSRVVVITKAPSAPTSSPSTVSAGLAGGVGAGAAVVVLLVSGILFWIWRRKRKAKRITAETIPYTPINGSAQTPTHYQSPITAMTAYHNEVPSEATAKWVRHELSHESMVPAELHGASKGHRVEVPERVNELQEMPAAHGDHIMKKDAGGR